VHSQTTSLSFVAVSDVHNAYVLTVGQNPLTFLLRAAQIYPDKVALVHPNTQYPVQYTYAAWYVQGGIIPSND